MDLPTGWSPKTCRDLRYSFLDVADEAKLPLFEDKESCEVVLKMRSTSAVNSPVQGSLKIEVVLESIFACFAL